MRKYLQVTVMLGILLFLVWLRNSKFEDDVTANISKNPITPTFLPSATPTITLIPITTTGRKLLHKSTAVTATPTVVLQNPTAAPISAGAYKDGSYTGSVADAYYGNMQVQAVIAGGKITDVIFLQYPNDNPTSVNINSQAMPLLKQEALQAQSANVSGVSGASFSSPAFKSSLASALSQAAN